LPLRACARRQPRHALDDKTNFVRCRVAARKLDGAGSPRVPLRGTRIALRAARHTQTGKRACLPATYAPLPTTSAPSPHLLPAYGVKQYQVTCI